MYVRPAVVNDKMNCKQPVSYTHLDVYKRQKVRKFKLVNSTNSRMANSNENNGGSDIEFDITNQMGEKEWEEATESESPEVSSEARGRRQNDDIRSETEQTQSQTETQQLQT